jgi:hypothetical protein
MNTKLSTNKISKVYKSNLFVFVFHSIIFTENLNEHFPPSIDSLIASIMNEFV